jgi:chaperone required for assembly of F1-ATPase
MIKGFFDDLPSQSEGARDPVLAARDLARPRLPKRFWNSADVIEDSGEFVLALDGRPARTPAGRALAVPVRCLAEALAQEWNALTGEIDPARLPLTRLVNVACDAVRDSSNALLITEIVKYAGSDLVCYRADRPDRLITLQNAHWTPVLDFARDDLGARFNLAEGVMFVSQPVEALEAVRAAVARLSHPLALTALASVTTLTGSALIALALAHQAMDADAAWAAAHVDEDFQISVWGEDAEASARRARRRAEFDAAALVLRDMRTGPGA